MNALFAAIHAALAASIPLVCFLTAVIWLANVADRTGLAGRIAHVLAGQARGSTARLYVLVCLACALLTATLSLDGAVVVMVPVILALVDLGAPGRPLLLATIGVANAFSIAVVQGNPTNLVVMSGLHLDPGTFDATMIGPGAAAALICAAVVAVREWPRLRGSVRTGAAPVLGRGRRGRGRRARCGRDRRGGCARHRPGAVVARLHRRRRDRRLARRHGRAPPWCVGAVADRPVRHGARNGARSRRGHRRRLGGAAPVRLRVGASGGDRGRRGCCRHGEQPARRRRRGRAPALRAGGVRRARRCVHRRPGGVAGIGRDAARARPRRPQLLGRDRRGLPAPVAGDRDRRRDGRNRAHLVHNRARASGSRAAT